MKRLRLYRIPKKYENYLKTKYWEKRKIAYWRKHERVCDFCKEFADDLHHITYERIGREYDKDLLPVCRKHHEQIHSLISNFEEVTLKTAHIVLDLILNLQKGGQNERRR